MACVMQQGELTETQKNQINEVLQKLKPDLPVHQREFIINAIRYGSVQVEPYEVSGDQVVLVSGNGRQSAQIPFPISIQAVESRSTHLISLSREGAKDLIRKLLCLL